MNPSLSLEYGGPFDGCERIFPIKHSVNRHKARCRHKPIEGLPRIQEFDRLRTLRIRRHDLLDELNELDRENEDARAKAEKRAKELIDGKEAQS